VAWARVEVGTAGVHGSPSSVRRTSPGGSVRSWIAVVLFGLPDLDLRLLAEAVVRHEDDSHAPSSVGDDEASELAPGELLVVDSR
jgi:hypothetical protein